MEFLIDTFFSQVDIFLMAFLRMLGFFIVVPVFGGKNIPMTAKLGMSFLITIIVMLTDFIAPLDYNGELLGLGLIAAKEFIMGLILGYTVYLIFSTVLLSGQLIDYNINFAMLTVVDPMSETQMALSGNLYYMAMLLFMLITNTHHFLLKAVIYSYKMVPLGNQVFSPELGTSFMSIMAGVFVIGVKIAAPIVGVILVLNVVLGILGKAAPQMNMLVVGLPLKSLVGLLMLMLVTILLPQIYNILYEQVEFFMLQNIRIMGL